MANPQIIIIMGGVCSGKSTLRREKYSNNFVNLDAADIFIKLSKGKYYDFPSSLKKKLNGEGEKLAFDSIKKKENIVIEVTGDNEKSLKELINAMKKINYNIKLVSVTCDIELELERNANRSDDNISSYYTQEFHYKWLLKAVDKLTA